VLAAISKSDERAMTESLRDLHLFVAVYEERSFTGAASREHATQSGVSQHIRKLEDSLGVRLFSRDKGRVLATPAGDSFYRRCIEMLRLHEEARRAVQTYNKGFNGEIVVGLMPTMTRCALAPVLTTFIDANPNVSVKVVEGYSASLTEQVRAGELDFAIVPAFACGPGLRSRLFLRTPEVLVSGAASRLVHHAPVRLAALGALKLVVPGKLNTRRNTDETYCASNGVEIERVVELDAMLATLDFVARSDWVTVLPGIMMALDGGSPPLKVNPLDDPPLSLDLVLIEPSRRTMTDAAQSFLATLEGEAQRLNLRWSAHASPVSAGPGPSDKRPRRIS
jgi:LysR family transcriptional regulator, nitrogen assimilation regulatory protein